jgi:lipid-A-disaccharide synthase
MDLIADLRDSTALGLSEVAERTANVALSYARILHVARRRKPRVALLVNYTEFNARIARALWREGTRILWYGAPQIWAWRKGRAVPMRRNLDRMAVMLPFEEPLWRDLGVDAHYVGHPALEELAAARSTGEEATVRAKAREALGMTPRAWAVAILPGSRPHEVERLLGPMLAGYESVRHDLASVDGRVLLAPSLDRKTLAWARALSNEMHVDTTDVDPRAGLGPLLPAFDVALCASGTASLECVLARAVPIVLYRVGWATELGARALVTTPFVALPNILLGRAAFPELLQRQVDPMRIAEELGKIIEQRETLLGACDEVERSLSGDGHAKSTSTEIARMIEPWLGHR